MNYLGVEKALNEIDQFVQLLETVDPKFNIHLCFGLLNESKIYSGLIFQVVCETDDGSLNVLATGGQYDGLFNSFGSDGLTGLKTQKHAVGVTIKLKTVEIKRDKFLNPKVSSVIVFSKDANIRLKQEMAVASLLWTIGVRVRIGLMHQLEQRNNDYDRRCIGHAVTFTDLKKSEFNIVSTKTWKVVVKNCSIRELIQFCLYGISYSRIRFVRRMEYDTAKDCDGGSPLLYSYNRTLAHNAHSEGPPQDGKRYRLIRAYNKHPPQDLSEFGTRHSEDPIEDGIRYPRVLAHSTHSPGDLPEDGIRHPRTLPYNTHSPGGPED